VLNHAVREAAYVRNAFEAETTHGGLAFPFDELVVVATCNRVEFYVACAPADSLRAAALLRTALEGSGEPTRLYVHHGCDAVRHLCRVAAGLDSLVLGEPQIAGQLAHAFGQTIRRDRAGTVLADVSAFARRVGRRARAETAISRGPVSISSVSIRLAGERMGGLAGKRILVLGAGKIGRATCEVLRSSGAHIIVANRTLAHAEAIAQRVGAEAVPLQSLPRLLARANAVIASTASPVALIDEETVSEALQLRAETGNSSTLLLIDIAVPCNVAEDVHGMAGVEVVGIDDLRTRVSAHLDDRRAEVPRVETIIEEELAEFTGASAVRV
jgi:glutamyl-tRNA reductase